MKIKAAGLAALLVVFGVVVRGGRAGRRRGDAGRGAAGARARRSRRSTRWTRRSTRSGREPARLPQGRAGRFVRRLRRLRGARRQDLQARREDDDLCRAGRLRLRRAGRRARSASRRTSRSRTRPARCWARRRTSSRFRRRATPDKREFSHDAVLRRALPAAGRIQGGLHGPRPELRQDRRPSRCRSRSPCRPRTSHRRPARAEARLVGARGLARGARVSVSDFARACASIDSRATHFLCPPAPVSTPSSESASRPTFNRG